MSLAAVKTEPSGQSRTPVLDIGAYLAGEPGAAAPLAGAIARTCEDTGFRSTRTARHRPVIRRRRGGELGHVPGPAVQPDDLPADYFAEAFAEPNCTIRLIHYPLHRAHEDNEFGFAPHTDSNFITFLAQSKLPGLEVQTAEGDWIRPPAVPGPFVVNTGAMLARYSNDRFRATSHRVINRNDR